MIGHFPEGEAMTDTLARCRGLGLSFDEAWRLGLHRARHGRSQTNPRWVDAELGLTFARPAFERAYHGHERTREDMVAGALLHACEAMYDHSEAAQSTGILEAA